MAKIKSIEHFRVKPRWLFVKVTDDEGRFGWGEGTLEGHSLAVEGALDEIITRIIGYEADDIEHIWQTVWRLGFYRGGPVFMSALSGIDIALWDLKGRKLGVPVHQLLGGKVRQKVQVYAWIGGDRPSDVEAAAKERIAQGLKCIKMNATEDVNWLDSPAVLQSCVERLKQVKALGLDAGLDFHGRLHRPMAKQLAKALEPYQPLFIEEPLLCEHPEAIKQLSEQTTIPIAFGERLYSRWDIKRFLEDSSVDILQPDIAHAGGISETKRIANMAEAYDVAIAPHCPLGPIALAASLQVAVSIPNFVIQEMSLGMHYNTEAGDIDLNSYLVDKTVFDIKEGYVAAPCMPGLGIDIDEDLVRKISKETEPWQPKEFFGPDGSIQYPVVSLFIPNADPQSLLGEVLAEQSATTTYSINCPAGRTNSTECGMGPGLFLTAAPTTVEYLISAEADNIYNHVVCDMTDLPTGAYTCTDTVTGKGASTPGTSTSTVPWDQISLLPVTITSTADAVVATLSTPTTTPPITTAPDTTPSTPAAPGGETSPPAATASPTPMAGIAGRSRPTSLVLACAVVQGLVGLL
ncbi:uncharacterized protein PGRI_023570 [Penicillium griseofulvum]|uniref:Mandelate racemase/muconate lactonizing enzyme C-terminal domain-containing protein n=1 Tax=Penicillium patulum TaxID=5078 RepID=A0A135LHN3_PENPA|nr:uncharacterized protein PGRI_023570 [Penicillium griseofulvum]KXG48487.1 hypothetical protein PGRI_023570 [Penicillium griseofulvum]